VAIMQQAVVQELHVERASALGSWQRLHRQGGAVLPGMQSAFVDIGCERAAFLHVAISGGTLSDGIRRSSGC